MIERYARKLAQGLIGNAEVEERWTGRFELMTRGLSASKPSPWGAPPVVSANWSQWTTRSSPPLRRVRENPPLRVRIKVLQTRVGEEFDT